MRDEDLPYGPRNNDGPQRNEHDESVDLIARDGHEASEEGYSGKRISGEDNEANRRPEPAPDANGQSDRIPDHRRAAELVYERVVARQPDDAPERPRKNVERQPERERAHEGHREDGPLERA